MEHDFFSKLEDVGLSFTPEQKERIERKISEKLNYTASIGVFGKTGVGKSSLCNSIFGTELYPVSDIGACTRAPQEELLKFGNKNLKLVDVPGVGENTERDEEYAALYNSLIPQLDLVFWVLKADDRAFSDDINFYKKIVSKYIDDISKPFFIVLNQVDKLAKHGEWNYEDHTPEPELRQKIDAKIQYVADVFEIAPSKIIPVSSEERYNLVRLIDEMVFALPKEKVVTISQYLDPKSISEDSLATITELIEDIPAEVVADEVSEEKNAAIGLIEKITTSAINGVSAIGFVSAEQLALEYLKKNGSLEEKVDSLIAWETSKSAMAGFVTGLGGVLTMPITIPSDMLATWVIEARLSAAIAYMYGHDIKEDQVRTFVIATICGDSVKEILKDIGIKVGQNVAKNMIKKIPGHVLRAINHKIGIKLISKAGQKSITSLTKMIPFFGGLIGGAVDAAYCKSVGKRAKSLFSNYNFE